MDNKSMAILGLVLSIVVGPVGIVFSAIALNKMKQSGETDGKGIAIAGLVIGIVYIAIVVLAVGCTVCAAACVAASGGY